MQSVLTYTVTGIAITMSFAAVLLYKDTVALAFNKVDFTYTIEL